MKTPTRRGPRAIARPLARSMLPNQRSISCVDERQKLQEKLALLQKQIENKTAQEIGEGPEADLFELLRGAFEGDRIRRVAKGLQGADVIHEVIRNGQVCGKIVYDAANEPATAVTRLVR